MKHQVFVDDYEDGTWEDVLASYDEGYLPEPEYLYAQYEYANYEGYSTVIYSYDGVKFYVVYGSHCSCYYLEGQWDPTEHSLEDLLFMYKDRTDPINEWLSQFSK